MHAFACMFIRVDYREDYAVLAYLTYYRSSSTRTTNWGAAWVSLAQTERRHKDVARGAGSFRVPSRFPCARMLMDASRLRRQVKLAYHITRGLWQ